VCVRVCVFVGLRVCDALAGLVLAAAHHGDDEDEQQYDAAAHSDEDPEHRLVDAVRGRLLRKPAAAPSQLLVRSALACA
jgi:hypothetical protein